MKLNKYIKQYADFLNESSGSIDVNGSQVDCYATDWDKGNLAYLSIVNRSAEGWILNKIGIFHGLDKDEMVKYNNEIQALMLDSSTRRDDYKYFICKNETDKEMFNTLHWKDLANQDATGAILKPNTTTSIEDFKNIIETHFPFVYFTNSGGTPHSVDSFKDNQ